MPRISRLFVLFVLLLSACFVSGERGQITFDDANRYPIQKGMQVSWDDRTFNPNVGVGTKITFEPGKTLGGIFASDSSVEGDTLYHAEITNPEVFEIIKNDGQEITLRAKKEGTALLTIESNDGLFDYIDLNAVNIMELRLLVSSKRTYFTGWGFGEPFTNKGFAVMPGALFETGIQALDKDGNWLSGVLPMSWEAFNSDMSASEYANAKAFEAMGGDVELSALINVDGEDVFLPLGIPEIKSVDELHLGIFNYVDLFDEGNTNADVEDEKTIEAVEGPIFRTIYLMDTSGRLVIPSEAGAIEVSVLEGPDCLVQKDESSIDGLADLNLTHFTACAGEGVLLFSYQGAEREVVIKVAKGPENSNQLD